MITKSIILIKTTIINFSFNPLSKVKSKLESQVSGMMGVTLLNLGDTAIDGKKQIQTTNKVVK